MTDADHPTAADLAAEAIALAGKATPGPWEATGFDECQALIRPKRDTKRHPLIAIISMGAGRPDDEGNRDLIAHAGSHYATVCRAYLDLLKEVRGG